MHRAAVVATDVGGVRDVVRDGHSAASSCPPGDLDAIADRLERLADATRSSASAHGRDGTQRGFSPRYSVPRLVQDIDSLYRTIAAAVRPRRRADVHRDRPTPDTALPARPPKSGSSKRGRRLRVILLSQYFPPRDRRDAVRMQAFAEHLSAEGHEVTVICEFPNHPMGVIPRALPRAALPR